MVLIERFVVYVLQLYVYLGQLLYLLLYWIMFFKGIGTDDSQSPVEMRNLIKFVTYLIFDFAVALAL